jgi:hypothetical protein
MVSSTSLRRLCALSLVIASALLGAAGGCGIISEESDCQNACDQLNTCGLLAGNNCGAYCAGTIVAVGQAGCTTQFDAQNACVTSNTTCQEVMTMCGSDVTAFGTCLATYCKKNPGAMGCSG